LDERFFLYYEDNDVCIRAKNEGLPVLGVPDAEAVHYYNQSPEPEEGKAVLSNTAHQKFQDKHYGHLKWQLSVSCKKGGDAVSFTKTEENNFMWSPLKSIGRLYFEFGVHPNFVPFAQSELVPDLNGNWPQQYNIPPEIWDKIAQGTYFCRLRDEKMGTRKIWQWQKK
jgi:hypothetical protein